MVEFYYWFQFLNDLFTQLFFYPTSHSGFITVFSQLAIHIFTYISIALLIIIPLAVIYRILRSLFYL